MLVYKKEGEVPFACVIKMKMQTPILYRPTLSLLKYQLVEVFHYNDGLRTSRNQNNTVFR
jgi:hypothetical protein